MRVPSPEDLREGVDASRATPEAVDADATAHLRDDRDGDAEEDAGVEGVVVVVVLATETTNMMMIDDDDNTRDSFF